MNKKYLVMAALSLMTAVAQAGDNPKTGFEVQPPFDLGNVSFHNGEWTPIENGYRSNLSGRGDGFAFFTAEAPRNFVYEADVTFSNRNESAASLVF
ncbi:MAG: hypothetical protein LBL13_02945, partial [Bacteroidales bacterium]|nr:hypothetical protein [Bacteroidales bacterium]